MLFFACSTSESSEEEKGSQSVWQTVSKHMPSKPETTESHLNQEVLTVSANQTSVNMPVPRKHKKKSKGKGKGKKPLPTTESAEDVDPCHDGHDVDIVTAQSPTSKSKKKQRRKKVDSLSSDEGSSGNVTNIAMKGNRVSLCKEFAASKVKQQLRGDEMNVHLAETVKAPPNSPKAAVQQKLTRLPHFTPTEIGPDEDPVFYHHSPMSETEKDDKVKNYLFRQIEGRKPLGSSPSTPTLFHMKESFGALVPALSPSLPNPAATLIVQLTPDGLVKLPTPLSKEVHEMLHSALLVWLASRATEATPSVNVQSVVNCNKGEKAYHCSLSDIELESMVIGDVAIPPSTQVDFRVNGMFQTIQESKPVMLSSLMRWLGKQLGAGEDVLAGQGK